MRPDCAYVKYIIAKGRGDGNVRVTLGQVAALAGVSTATVSRALNAPSAVSDALRGRVGAAVARLGYLPNQTARALSSQHSRLAGILIERFDPGCAEMLDAIQLRLDAAGYATLITTTGGDSDRTVAAARAMGAREVEGLLLVGIAPEHSLQALLAAHRIPSVSIEAGQSPTAVGGDYVAGGAIVGTYLVGLGHRSLAYVGDPANLPWRSSALLQGLRATLSARDSRSLSLAVAEGAVPAIRVQLRQWLRASARPTALMCSDDLLALAMLRECALLGIAVPGELSVVGCGDLPLARHTSPALSTLRIPGAAIGTAAADRLLGRMTGGPPTSQAIPIKLVIRQSTGPGSRLEFRESPE
jgi:LacI family transcriptional regulator